jgi:glycine/D-amino acid oxidase-like deaminating enzyme
LRACSTLHTASTRVACPAQPRVVRGTAANSASPQGGCGRTASPWPPATPTCTRRWSGSGAGKRTRQIVVTERLRPFLNIQWCAAPDRRRHGDDRRFKEESTDPAGLTIGVSATEAERAVRQFPLLANVNVVRTWSAIRVMPQDGFPIYDESESHPGAFTVCCHSGVTLAANHALTIAPMIARGSLDKSLVAPFSARRFHVQEAG